MKASPYTRLFWIEHHLNPIRKDYHYIFDQDLQGPLSIERLKRSIERFIQVHALFNSHLENINGELHWIKNKKIYPLITVAVDNLSSAPQPQTLVKSFKGRSLQSIVDKPFNLEKGPLYRFILECHNDDTYRLVIVLHHVIIDGRHAKRFMDAISNFYNEDLMTNNAVNVDNIEKLNLFFEEYNQYLSDYGSKEFWMNYLGDVKLNNPITSLKPLKKKFDAKFIRFSIKIHADDKQHVLDKYGAFNVLMVVWGILIAKYNREATSIIKYSIGLKEATEFYFGAQINVLLNKTVISKNDTLLDLLDRNHAIIKAMRLNPGYKHSYFSSSEFWSDIDSDQLDVSFAQTSMKDDDCLLRFNGCKASINHDFQSNTYGSLLGLEYEKQGDNYSFRLVYRGEYFTSLFIDELSKQYLHLLQSLLLEPSQPLASLSILSPLMAKTMLVEWNDNSIDVPKKSLIELFSEQVRKKRNHVAIVLHEHALTYAQLDDYSNQLAYDVLMENTGQYIALYMTRSIEMIISVLAILKVNKAYVPIDPLCPEARVKYMLEDTQCALLLTNTDIDFKDSLPANTKTMNLGQTFFRRSPRITTDIKKRLLTLSSLKQAVTPESIAYIIYTSGTTGVPKGVMVTHRNLVNYALNVKQLFCGTRRVDFSSSLAFDLSFTTSVVPLLIGKTVCIYPYSLQDVAAYIDHLKNNRIDFIKSTPLFLSQVAGIEDGFAVKRCVVGGEMLTSEQFQLISRMTSEIYDEYGPTETTVGATIIKKSTHRPHSIGKAYANVRLYVLDKHLTPMPLGAVGELYIAGEGLAKGYLNQDTLTSQRFITHSFELKNITIPERLYRTGDLVRYFSNGDLEYLGREDNQVKIRGFRVELDDIASLLKKHADIADALVMVSEKGGHKMLIAYLVADEFEPSPTEITEYLSIHLPPPMIPAAVIFIERIPMTINGKIDYKALPGVVEGEHVSARNETEQLFCKIWQEVLNVPVVGVHDDFFRLGGQSILGIQLVHQISKCINRTLQVADLLKYRTIAQLSQFILSGDNLESIEAQEGLSAELSFAQDRLWFIEQCESNVSAYHIPITFELPERVSLSVIQRIMTSLMDRHRIFRTCIKPTDVTRPVQEIRDKPFSVSEYYIDDLNHAPEIHAFINNRFDLTKNYPIRSALIHYKNTDTVMVVIHHIAFDEWSRHIFNREFWHYYEYWSRHQTSVKEPSFHQVQDDTKSQDVSGPLVPHDLPALPIEYKDFSTWQRKQFIKRQAKLKQYWLSKFEGYTPFSLPSDYRRPPLFDYQGASFRFDFPKPLISTLHELSQAKGLTVFTLLLAGFTLTLYRYTGQSDVTIGTPITNRQHPELSGLIGFFVNTLALRFQIDPTLSGDAFLNYVQNELIDAQLNQDLPFEELVQWMRVERDLSRHPLFQIMFVVQYSDTSHKETGDIKNFVDKNYNISKFDVTLTLDVSSEQVTGTIEYATSLFAESTIQCLANAFVVLMQAMMKNREFILYEYELLSADERKLLCERWARGSSMESREAFHGIHQRFEARVHASPLCDAIIFKDRMINYRMLNEAANQIAHTLIFESKKSLNDERTLIKDNNPHAYELVHRSVIALFAERTPEAIAAMLAILKVGSAYLAIEPHYPDDRIASILKDARCHFVFSSSTLTTRLERIKFSYSLTFLTIFTMDEETVFGSINQNHVINLPVDIEKNSAAYVIYTSGTTGTPKGILQTHHTLTNLVDWDTTVKNSILHGSRIAQFASFSFDVSAQEIFCALSQGLTLVLLSDESKRDMNCLLQELNHYQINELYLPVALLNSFCESCLSMNTFPLFLKRICVAGSALFMTEAIQRFIQCTDITIENHYGPSETHVVTSYVLDKSSLPSYNVPIGRPISNVELFILDKFKKMVPIGCIGELYVGGASLALGYLNKPDLTKEQFITNPIEGAAAPILYQTGDRVRWLANGLLEYIDRKDAQVKIRGYRVELAEIEEVMLMYPHVKECSVIHAEKIGLKKDQLIAYYSAQHTLNQEQLYQHLKRYLPDYMLPSRLIALDVFPLNHNGKLDYARLPQPEQCIKSRHVVSPRHPTEVALLKIWQEALDLSSIEVDDDFFAIGGHSLIAIQIATKIEQTLQFRIAIIDFLKLRTIAKLAEFIEKNRFNQQSMIKTLNSKIINKPTIHFIHSALGGCEVYLPLVESLESHYASVGVENYLSEQQGYSSKLSDIASHYLESLEKFAPLPKSVFLSGWSLGGNIALEIAHQLEMRGYQDIKLCLFDTFIVPSGFKNNLMNLSLWNSQLEQDMINYQIRFSTEGANANYTKQAMHAIQRAHQLMKAYTPSFKLKYSKVLLFKAHQARHEFDAKVYHGSPHNHLQDFIHHPITVIKLQAHHDNLLENCLMEITSPMCNWFRS